jgi:hypothetical protein
MFNTTYLEIGTGGTGLPYNQPMDREHTSMPQITKAIILFEGRCGSSHLTGIFSQHPNAAFFGEEITSRPTDDWDKQKAQMEEVFSLREHNGKMLQMVGFKTKLRVIDREHHPDFIRLLSEHDVRVIRMFRRNLVKQAISAHRAHRLVTEYGVYNVPTGHPSAKPVDVESIELDQLRFQMQHLNKEEPEIDDFMMRLPKSIKRMVLSYEELLTSRNDTIRRVYKFLGMEFHCGQDVFIKNTDDDLHKAITNYEELKKWLSGTRYVSMVEDQVSPSEARHR